MTSVARAWIQKHITGTPEANARLEAAERAREDHILAGGSVDDEVFAPAVREAQSNVPWLRRFGWL